MILYESTANNPDKGKVTIHYSRRCLAVLLVILEMTVHEQVPIIATLDRCVVDIGIPKEAPVVTKTEVIKLAMKPSVWPILVILWLKVLVTLNPWKIPPRAIAIATKKNINMVKEPCEMRLEIKNVAARATNFGPSFMPRAKLEAAQLTQCALSIFNILLEPINLKFFNLKIFLLYNQNILKDNM